MLDDENRKYLIKKKKDIMLNCPICHGTKPYCKCAYDFRVEINKASSNIPIAYRDFTLDDLTHPQLVTQKQQVIAYLDTLGSDSQNDLIITGGPGLAKSAVACYVLIKLLHMHRKVYYFPSLRAVMDACISYLKGDISNDVYQKFSTADTIVIDGLGYGFIRERTNGTDIVLEQLERRRLVGKHTIFVSSVEMCDLEGGERTLVDLLHPEVINFKGFDYVKEVIEQVDEKKAKAVKKVSVRSIKRKKTPEIKEDGTPMSPFEIAEREANKEAAKTKKRKKAGKKKK